MFLDNKYTKWYFSIIEKAKEKNLPRKRLARSTIDSELTELHHIIPKSMGGTDEVSNLIRFSPREHFVCHWLLTKMTTSTNKARMVTAFILMTGVGSKSARYNKINSKSFQRLREEYARSVSKRMTGRVVTPETRAKISLAHTGRPLSAEHKLKMSEATKGRPRTSVLTDDGKRRIGEANRNRERTEEERKKHSINNSGKGNPFYGKKHTKEVMDRLIAYHNDPKVLQEKSERVKGDKNPSKRPDVRIAISKGQKERMARERESGTGYFSPEASTKRKLAQSGAGNGNAKTYEITDPDGGIHLVTGGLKKFCKEHAIRYSTIAGKTEVLHNGWRIKYIPKKVDK